MRLIHNLTSARGLAAPVLGMPAARGRLPGALLVLASLLAPGCGLEESRLITHTSGRAGGPGEPAANNAPDLEPVSAEQSWATLGIECNARLIPTPDGYTDEDGPFYEMTFTLPADARSFLVVPLVDGGVVSPDYLITPTEDVDLFWDYHHHNGRLADMLSDLEPWGTFGTVAFDWPILFPYAPQYQSLVVPGAQYALHVSAGQREPCLYVAVGRGGTRLDLNLYFVGVPGLDAAAAPEHADLHEALAHMADLFGTAGIEPGRLRYFDVSAEHAEAFTILRDSDDADLLTALSAPPNTSLDGHLSLNVFFVQDIMFSEDSRTLGISPSLPGAPGMHGNLRSGVVLETSELGSANARLGHILAHEIGHFLGLRHTTEVFHGDDSPQAVFFSEVLGSTDPIDDTPECPNLLESPGSCPDLYNLMFPFAPPSAAVDAAHLSDGQRATLRASPFLK